MLVSPNLVVVPDGVYANLLALSVQVAPCHVAGDNETVELEDWPEVIAKLSRSLLVTVSALPLGTTDPSKQRAVSALDGFFFDQGPARLEAARQLWRRQFLGQGFLDLQEAVTWPAPASSTRSKSEPFRFLNRRTSDLTQVMKSMLQLDPDQSYPLRLALATTNFDMQRRQAVLSTSPSVADALRNRLDEIAAVDEMSADITAKSFLAHDCAALLCGIRDDFMVAMGQSSGSARRATKDSEEPGIDEDRERANRKLMAMQAIPPLAHYLGLALRVFIPTEYLGPLEKGAIRVEFGSAVHQRPSWTAFEYDRATGYFGPLPDEGKMHLPLSRGLVRLAEKLDATHDRFMVSDLDPVNTLIRMIQQIKKRSATSENDEGFDKLRRGFALFDRIKHVASLEAHLDDAVASDKPFDARAVLHAQDLIQGLRPDVAFAAPGDSALLQAPERWCPLTRRRVGCTDVIAGLFDRTLYGDPAILDFRHCEDGYAVAPECLTPVSNTHEHPVDEELLSWCGESLAVSAANPQGIKPEDYLDLSVAYDLGDDEEAEEGSDASPTGSTVAADERLPPLREDRHYVFGCRVAYLNGAGRTIASARQDYATDPRVLLGRGSSAIEFTPEAIPAPGLHFHFSDPQVLQASPRRCAGESVETLVVRSSGDDWDTPSRTRLLFPPRITFDKAELEGQFDEGEQSSRDVPIGPFSDEAALPTRLFMDSGDFPEAWAGQLCYWRKYLDLSDPSDPVWKRELLDIDTHRPVDQTEKQSRGTVALIGKLSGRGVGQHFTTRHGRTATASLIQSGARSVPDVQLQFWNEGQKTHDAHPVVLCLERGGQLQMKLQTRQHQLPTGGHVLLPHLVVTLPAATTVELVVTPDFSRLDSGAQPISTRVMLVHAQRLPAKICPVQGAVRAVTIDTTADTAEKDAAWRAYVPTGPAKGWESQEAGSQTYFIGELSIDRKTTGRVRMEISWDEYDESRVVRNELGVAGSAPEWIERPKRNAAQIFDIEVELGPSANPLSLLRENGQSPLRNLSHAFADGRARQLRPTLVTTSRYEKFFSGEAETTVTTRECVQLESVWTCCTFRPPPPDTDRIVPSFGWKTLVPAGKPRDRVTTRHGSQLRIYLSSGWYASGEGEQLGIVLLREEADEQTILETHRPFISRCGLDPLRPGGTTDGAFLTRRHFPPGMPDLVEDVQLFVNSDAKDSVTKGFLPIPTMQVDVLPLSVCIEEATGALYCDVQLLGLNSYTPFVHFGLVRYQAHAVRHLQMSTPIVRIAQILPFRKVETRRISARKRLLQIKGPGYEQSDTCYSSLDLTLLNRKTYEDSWKVYEHTLFDPDKDEIPWWPFKGAKYSLDKGEFGFNANFMLPNLDPREEFALLVEEYEHLPTDAGDVSEGRDAMDKRLFFAWIQALGSRG